jgi:DNA-directed RNA polymerase specialized sigma24 family protein
MTTSDDRRASFEALFRIHHAHVRAYVRRRNPGAAADDAVAETFLVAWRRLEEIGEDPLPWLLAVARRVLANQRRGEHRRAALVGRLTGAAAADPGWEPPAAMSPALAGALAGLSPREREALLLVAWEGLEPARAARAAGCSPAAFRVRLHRARRRVADRLAASRSRPHPPFLEESR